MIIFIATTLAFALGVIIGIIYMLAMACRHIKEDVNITDPIIKKTKTEIINCLSCGGGKRIKEGRTVYECQNCNDEPFWV